MEAFIDFEKALREALVRLGLVQKSPSFIPVVKGYELLRMREEQDPNGDPSLFDMPPEALRNLQGIRNALAHGRAVGQSDSVLEALIHDLHVETEIIDRAE